MAAVTRGLGMSYSFQRRAFLCCNGRCQASSREQILYSTFLEADAGKRLHQESSTPELKNLTVLHQSCVF